MSHYLHELPTSMIDFLSVIPLNKDTVVWNYIYIENFTYFYANKIS